MLKTRYDFFKKMHRDYVVVFATRGHFYLFESDMSIVKTIKKKKERIVDALKRAHINYAVIDNLSVVDKQIFEDNFYKEALHKSIVMKAVQEFYKNESAE